MNLSFALKQTDLSLEKIKRFCFNPYDLSVASKLNTSSLR
jgi:hypothetical protein